MSAEIGDQKQSGSPWWQTIAETVGLTNMLKTGGIHFLNPLKYFGRPKKIDVKIPEGTEHVIILIPGFSGPGTTLNWMAKQLSKDGMYAMTWGDHTNIGPFPHIIEHLFDLIKEVSEKSGKKVVLVGHSLGGSYAMHALHEMPEYVEGAITMGSPIETTIEGLCDATVLGPAAKLMANKYVQMLMHKGIIGSWVPESARDEPEGYRFTVAASLDSVVHSFASMVAESFTSRHVVVKDDHLGMPTNKLVVKMIDKVVRARDPHADFGEKINSLLLDADQLEKMNGLPHHVKMLSHMTRGHRRRMKVLQCAIDNLRNTGQELVVNAPRAAIDLITSPIANPRVAEHNAEEELPEGVISLITERTQRRGNGGAARDPRSSENVAEILDPRQARQGPGFDREFEPQPPIAAQR